MESLQAGAAPLDKYVGGRWSDWARPSTAGVGVLVGLAMYLPFSITLAYGLGCLASIRLKARNGERWIGDTLVPVAAGFIIGEALTTLGVVLFQMGVGA